MNGMVKEEGRTKTKRKKIKGTQLLKHMVFGKEEEEESKSKKKECQGRK